MNNSTLYSSASRQWYDRFCGIFSKLDFNAHGLGTGLSDNNPPAVSAVKWSLCNLFVEWNAETPNPSSITNCRICDNETNLAQVRFAWGRICTELSSSSWNYSLVLWLSIARISMDYTIKMIHPRCVYRTIKITKYSG